MVTQRALIVGQDKAQVIARVADDSRRLLVDLLERAESAHVVLTGGSVGIGVLEYLGATDSDVLREERVDWSRVHLWWGDERWVPAGHEDRNDAQAEAVFMSRLPFRADHVHRMPASDAGLSIDEAAHVYATELARILPGSSAGGTDPSSSASETTVPRGQQCFDLVFLGIGPDAHVASLFPGRAEEAESSVSVIPIRNSPKPPPERLSLTLRSISSSHHVWLVTAGTDKADAVRLTLGRVDVATAPASAVSGRSETRVYCDVSASPSHN